MRTVRTFLRRYRLPLAAAALCFFFTPLLAPLDGRFPFALFLLATLVSALHGGLKPGLVATGLSAGLLALYHRFGSADPSADPDFIPRLALFLPVGLLAGYLSRECKQAVRAVSWLHDTLSVLGDAVLLTDEHGRVTFLNPAAERLTGCRREEAAGRPFTDVFPIVHEDTRRPAEDPVAQVLDTGAMTSRALHAHLSTGQGIDRPIEYRAAPLRDGRGRLAGVFLGFRDVGDRWRADQELRQREEHFRSLAACAPAALLVMDSAGRCTWTNAAWQEAAGLGPEEALGEGWVRAVHPDDREWLLVDWVGSVRKGRAFAGDFRFQTPRGEVRWVHLRSAPLTAADGRPLGHVGAFAEAASRKHAEQTLAESQALCRAVLDAVPHPVLVKDAQGRFQMVNAAGARFLDATAEEAAGKDETTLLPPDRARHLREGDRQALATGQAHSGEVVEKTPAGARTYVVARLPYRDGHGKVAGLVSLWQDVTDRKQAEAALREAQEAVRDRDHRLSAFLENLPGLVFLKDGNGRHLYVNETHARLGKGKPGDWHGKTDDELLPPALAQRFQQHEREVLARRKPQQTVEEVHQPDGVRHWMLRRFPLLDRQGRPAGLGGIGLDVTEQRRLEAALRKSQEEMEGKVRERTAGMEKENAHLRKQMEEHRLAEAERRGSQERSLREMRSLAEFLAAVIESAPAGIVACDGAGKVVVCNPAARASLGMTEEAQTGPEPWAAVRLRRPGEQARLPLEEVPLLQALRGQAVQGVELATTSGEGVVRRLWAGAAPLNPLNLPGRPAGAAMVIHDWTEDREALEELRRHLAGHQETHDRLRQELAGHQQAREVVWQELLEHRQAREQLQQHLSGRQQEQERLRQELAGHQQAREALWHELQEHRQAREQLQQALAGYQQEQERLHHDLAGHREARERLQQEVAGHLQERERLGQELAGHRQMREQLERELAGHRQMREQLERELAGHREAQSRLEQELAGHREARNRLEEEKQSWERQVEEQQARLAREQAARAEAERGSRRSAFLASAGRALASSLDSDTILQNLARSAVPFLGDWCAVHGLGEDGAVRQLTGAQADIAATYQAWEAGRPAAQRVQSSGVAARVIRTGQSALYPESPGASPDGPDSGMCVPLVVQGQTIGAVSFEIAGTGRRHEAEDLGAAEELVRHAGRALENARLYQDARAAGERLGRELHLARSVADSLAEGVCAVDRAGRVTFLNRAAGRLLGWKSSDLLGRDVREVIAQPAGTGVPADALLTGVLAGGPPVHGQGLVLRHRDGTTVPVAGSLCPMVEGNQVEGAALSFRKRVEERPLPGKSAPAESVLEMSAGEAGEGKQEGGSPQAVLREGPDWLGYN